MRRRATTPPQPMSCQPHESIQRPRWLCFADDLPRDQSHIRATSYSVRGDQLRAEQRSAMAYFSKERPMKTVSILLGISFLIKALTAQVATAPAIAASLEPDTQQRYTYFVEKRGDTLLEKRGVLRLNNNAILRTPKWTTESPNPPVSAKQAIAKASVVARQMLKDDDRWFWGLASAALTPLSPENPGDKQTPDCWYWLITYEAFSTGGMTGPSQQLEVAVLMDGTVVRPTIEDYKRVKFGGESPEK